ncbi:hypothetical protein KVR01_004739 [Diaporthe batatas]|uniref:uncharacterized protein n=1 Tax=Diaporthe batatas TaxID=748121 RepID=UPI001D040543|nr:uncharacterized protein KVR01_004739 [Diaporthe batatas]KAG8166187.1 hypothetical protein KVR01_004739 [Diaporthe batatas]
MSGRARLQAIGQHIMTSPRPAPSTVAGHLAGSSQSWHGNVSPDGPFQPETGRYRLYIGLFCPFAHRANIARHLKGLQHIIPVTVVKPYPKGDQKGWPGWQFPSSPSEYHGADPEPLFGAKYLHELYFKADPEYKGRYSVPLLWDTETNTIVNNESTELLRDLQTGFNSILPEQYARVTLYPEHLRDQIDNISVWMQRDLNTGVYKAGFATTQEDYDKNVPAVFAALNKLEKIIAQLGGPYILGDDLTELDVRAYATVVRFDTVYVQHFKCNLGTIRHDYPQINNWLKNLYWNIPAFRDTTDFKHIKDNYTKSHGDINPRAITPLGPWPEVEEGYESDLSKVPTGGVKMPLVLELEKKL